MTSNRFTAFRRTAVDSLEQQVDRLTRQRDELVAALTKIAQWDHPSHPIFETAPVSVDALAEIARAALAKVQP